MIKLQVIGHLGKDCAVNTVNGKTVINFSVAHAEKFKDNTGAQKDRTIWVECAYWTDRTAVAQYLKKGTQVYAEGNPDVRNYTTQDGRQGTSLTLRVISVQLLGGGQDRGGGDTSTPYSQQQTSESDASAGGATNEVSEPSDDLPF